MIDFAQLLLIIIVSILTVLLVVIGLQVIKILGELKRTLEKVNKILDDAGTISENLARPLDDLSGFFKMVGLLVDFVKERKKRGEDKEEKEEKQEREEDLEEKIAKPRRRFFVRRGEKLA